MVTELGTCVLWSVKLGWYRVTYLCPEGSKVGEVFVVELLKGPGVLAVGDEPVDGREMFPLGQLFLQPPEYLHNTQGCRGHGVREVTTRG